MTITVAIPTIGRTCLRDAVRSVRRQIRRPDRLIVVNQGGDEVAGWVREAWGADDFTIVSQSEPGLSRARNGALAAWETDWIYWLDDDEEANSDNLWQLEALIQAHPEVDFFGGTYLPPLQMPEGMYCDVQYALGDQPITKETWNTAPAPNVMIDAWGGNAAFSRRLVEQVGLYDEHLGAGTDRFPRGEDTDYAARALSAGFTGLFTPRLSIYHTHGARKPSGDEQMHAIQTSAVLKWKSLQDPSVVAPEVADRMQVFGRKKLLASRFTGGAVFGRHLNAARERDRLLAELEREFVLREGRLAPRPVAD